MPRGFSKPVRLFFLNISISFFVTIFILLLTQDVLIEFPPLKRAELSLIDMRFRQRSINPVIKNKTDIIIVEISQESFKSLPAKWPWPRTYYTKLVKNLKRAGASTIGIDILFGHGDSMSSTQDEQLRSAIREAGNVVLAGKIETELKHYIIQEKYQNYGNAILDTTINVGIVNTREDVDGVVRRYMPFIYDEVRQLPIPTFSMAAANIALHQTPAHTAIVEEGNFRYREKIIPQYDPISFLINYYGPSNTFKRIRFADVIDDKELQTIEELNNPGEEINTFDDPEYGYLYDGTFKDKIVLVGSTMPEDKDLFPTPIAKGEHDDDNKMYGVEIHANVIQSILDGNFIWRQPLWMTALIVFGLSLFTFVFTEGLKAIRTKYSVIIEILGVALVLAELFLVYWLSLQLFIKENFLTDMTSSSLAIIVCYVGSTVYSYITERKQKDLIKNMFSRYVNPTIVDELIAHPEKLQLGGERKDLTVFFSDIENFTQISEKMPPENLVAILNEYLSEMTAIILTNDGTLDKYEGDAIVAFWGAPIPHTDHAYRACNAALQMQKRLEELRIRWRQENRPLLNTRIGINTGELIVGNMGGVNRFDYTVIGDSVNLGARLEGANKVYRTSIMISESTYKQVEGKVYARELDLLVVSGKTEFIRVYELVGLLGDRIPDLTEQFINIYDNGLNLYRNKEWDEAILKFRQALELAPGDYPSQMYIERAETFKDFPPPDDWNGVFILQTK